MNSKTSNIISLSLTILLSLLLLMSAFMKLSGAEEVVNGLSAIGLGKAVSFLGVIELVSVVLFLIPKTRKIGFLFLCSYLGGAASIELASGKFPVALVFIAIAWISVYLKDKQLFLPSATVSK